MKKATPLLLLFLAVSSPLTAGTFSRTQVLMGDVPVTITIKTKAGEKDSAYQAMEQSFETARRLEKKISEFNPHGDATRLNQNAGKKRVKVNAELIELLDLAQNFSIVTEGAFDITYSSPNKKSNYQDVIIDKGKSTAFLKKKGTRIGLSSIAKGYLVDRMSSIITRAGFKKYIVNAGGDLFAKGRWRVKIRNKSYQMTVKNQAVASAGLDERGPHIFDPQTKKPVIPSYQGVTVVASACVVANPLATAAFVRGSEIREKIKNIKNRLFFW